MVVDFSRLGLTELEIIGLARPHFDKLVDHDPALEKYDYIFLNDCKLLGPKNEITVETARYLHPTPRTNREETRPPLSSAFERSDQSRVNDSCRSMSERTIVVPFINPQKRTLFGASQMTEHQLLLMPYRVPAFSLNTKKWCMFCSDSQDPGN